MTETHSALDQLLRKPTTPAELLASYQKERGDLVQYLRNSIAQARSGAEGKAYRAVLVWLGEDGEW